MQVRVLPRSPEGTTVRRERELTSVHLLHVTGTDVRFYTESTCDHVLHRAGLREGHVVAVKATPDLSEVWMTADPGPDPLYTRVG